MFSLLPLPITPIRPASTALPMPDPAPRLDPGQEGSHNHGATSGPNVGLDPAALRPSERVDPAQRSADVDGLAPVPLAAKMPVAAKTATQAYGGRPDPVLQGAVTDIQMRATAARTLAQDSGAAVADSAYRQTLAADADLIPRDPAPEPRVILTP